MEWTHRPLQSYALRVFKRDSITFTGTPPAMPASFAGRIRNPPPAIIAVLGSREKPASILIDAGFGADLAIVNAGS